VSVTTVSHVLNDVAYARVSVETRDKVRSAAEQLGYGPNRLAQALRSRRTGMLGLVSEDIATTPHAGRILLGADDAARARGCTLMVINTSASASTASREADVKALLERQVDGILYATMYHRRVEVPPNLGKVPAVLVDAVSAGGGFVSVVPDEYSGAAPVQAASSDAQGGYAAARRILGGDNPPSALFCYNDRMAMGAYRAAAELGLSIPADLSVVGFDDQELIAANLHPGLTTVALPHYEMGAWAAERLIDTVEGTPLPGASATEPVLLNCPLVTRASVAGPRV
jgi:LacI family transcriptional regulator